MLVRHARTHFWCGVLRRGSHWVRFLRGTARCSDGDCGTRCGQVMRNRRSHWMHTMISHNRLVDDHFGWPPMIDRDKVGAVEAGIVLHLDLGPHGRGVRFAQCNKLRGTGPEPYAALTTMEADADIDLRDRMFIDIVNDGYVDVVDSAVVIEMTGVPVTALVAGADIAEAVVNAAVKTDVWAPVSVEETIVIVRVAPIAGRPKRALIGCFDPYAGNPVVAG